MPKKPFFSGLIVSLPTLTLILVNSDLSSKKMYFRSLIALILIAEIASKTCRDTILEKYPNAKCVDVEDLSQCKGECEHLGQLQCQGKRGEIRKLNCKQTKNEAKVTCCCE